jgi:hypothetical protein
LLTEWQTTAGRCGEGSATLTGRYEAAPSFRLLYIYYKQDVQSEIPITSLHKQKTNKLKQIYNK